MTDTLVGNKFNVIALPFNQVNGGGIDLNKDVTFTGVAGSDWADACDFIHIWDPAVGYTFFYYHCGDQDPEGWKDTNDFGYFEDFYEDGLPSGSTMWYEAYPDADRSEPLSITYSGAVEGEKYVTLELVDNKFNAVANPYPVAVDLNDKDQVVWTGVAGSDWADACDFIHIWDPAVGYTFFYYHCGDQDPEGWKDTNDFGYFKDFYEDGLPAGKGFWYESYGDADRSGKLIVTFKSPLK